MDSLIGYPSLIIYFERYMPKTIKLQFSSVPDEFQKIKESVNVEIIVELNSRKDSGMTQTDLAKILHITQGEISNLISNKLVRFSLEKLLRILTILRPGCVNIELNEKENKK